MTVNTETILAWLCSRLKYIDVCCRTKQSSTVFGDHSPVQKAGMQMLLGRCTYFTFYFYRLTEIFISDLHPGFSLSNVQSSIMVENGEKEHPLFPPKQ